MTDPLTALTACGVSVWLDDLSRELLAGGGLQHLIDTRRVTGVTTNPTIFASALAQGGRYDEQMARLAARDTAPDEAIFQITTADVRNACDMLSPVYQATGGADGRVSIEVDPRLARDTTATTSAARALAEAVARPNVHVKIPATAQGLPAITAAISAGISVNVTLIFSLQRYREVISAYLAGLEQALEAGRDLADIHSVASFFISRVDTEIDARLEQIAAPQAVQAKGKAGIANARLAYQACQQILGSGRWQRLKQSGANPQRPLWASTGVKDPAYPDTMYISQLIAAGTVNTMPGPTLDAFADHGEVPGDTITGTYDASRAHLAALARLGIGYAEVTALLETQALRKFEASWDQLSATVAAELHRNRPAAISGRRRGGG